VSIYGSTLAFSDSDHEDGCEFYVETSPGILDYSGRPCSCGTPSAPIVYEGSHVLPSDTDRRGGDLNFAVIPDFIERDGREDGPHDWLRVGMVSVDSTLIYEGKPYQPGGRAVVVLDRRQVEEMRDYLTSWLEREGEPSDD
jgi:hypothetical protein